MKSNLKIKAIIYVCIAAVCYGTCIPTTKYLGDNVSANALFFFNNLSSFLICAFSNLLNKRKINFNIQKKDYKHLILVHIIDVLAPLFLVYGITRCNSTTSALLSGLEIIFTVLISFLVYKEKINRNVWIAIVITFISTIIVTVDFKEKIVLSIGALFCILSSLGWGISNNELEQLHDVDVYSLNFRRSFIASIVGLMLCIISKEEIHFDIYFVISMLLGFVGVFLVNHFTMKALKHLSASKCTAIYSFNPYVSILLCFILFKDSLDIKFYIGLVFMFISTILIVKDTLDND